MEKVKADAEKAGQVVRFVGSVDVDKGDVEVGLKMVAMDHPIAGLRGSDNIINFYTERYGDRPLTIQGPGAGGEVTAMGVSSDLVKVIQRLQ
ncbi:MAG: hypothetical protein Q9187_008687 [Circinaria calcarea]